MDLTLSSKKIRGDCARLKIVDKVDKGGDVSGGVVENNVFGVKNSLSPNVSGRSKVVSNLSPVDPLELFFTPSKNGCIQLLLLSISCFLYSLAAAMSSLALALAIFFTNAY